MILNKSIFINVVSRYEAAILFVLLEQNGWSLKPVNINDCIFKSCYSTGEYFQILDDYSDKYPSVLIHEFIGFLSTSIDSNTSSVSAVNCQENKIQGKKFGAIFHFHTNFKIDSSQVFFTQSHKQASNVNHIYATGQAGYSFIEIKDIQSTDQLIIQYFNIYNSTLSTKELSASDNKADYVESNFGIIDFGGEYSGSVVFINCQIKPKLALSSNGRLPIFANCYSNVDSIASEQGFTFGTPFQSIPLGTSSICSPTTVEISVITPSQSPTLTIQIVNVNNNKIKNVIVVSVSIVATAILTVVCLVAVHIVYYNKIVFIDETDESADQQKEFVETINNDSSLLKNLIYNNVFLR